MIRSSNKSSLVGASLLLAGVIATVLPVATTPASALSTWTVAQSSAPAGGWSSVAFLHGEWLAFAPSGQLDTSSNGSTWNEHSVPVGSWHSAAYGAGRFVALSSANVDPSEMVSDNGVQWSTRSGPPGTPQQAGHPSLSGEWSGVAYGHGLFVAVSAVGTVATSVDGISWVRRFWRPQDDFTSITYGDGRFVAVDASEGDVMMSLDGLRWSLIRQPLTGAEPPPPGGLHFSAVTYGDGNFIAFGSATGAGYVATSVYGYVWSLHRYAPAQNVDAAAYGCASFVAAGQASLAAQPTDTTASIISSGVGEQWTQSAVSTPGPSTWTSIAYGAGRYVAVDAAGDIALSRSDANCRATAPSPPQQVSGNIHNGEVWTYMHPPKSSGAAPVLGYRVAITNGVTTRYCGAKVYFEPNCIIRGLANHQIYWVTTQAFNRFGYSAPTDPEFVISVGAWTLLATAPTAVVPAPVRVQITGVIANAEGIYPTALVALHLGSRVVACRPNPFGECALTVPDPPVGTVPMYATYTGYGRSYRSPTYEVRIVAG
jgi:hypothetical protein